MKSATHNNGGKIRNLLGMRVFMKSDTFLMIFGTSFLVVVTYIMKIAPFFLVIATHIKNNTFESIR